MAQLLREGLLRLSGKSDQAVFELTQAMGGGKTHMMIALGLLARHPHLRQDVLPSDLKNRIDFTQVRIAAFKGRIRYPLKRVSAHGEGRWRRISREDGLREVADQIIDVMVSDGPGSIVWDMGTANTGGGNGTGIHRAGHVRSTAEIEATHQSWFDEGGQNKRLTLLDAGASGDLGYCVLAWAGDYRQPDGSYVSSSGRSVNVLRRTAQGDWQIAISSLNADPA